MRPGSLIRSTMKSVSGSQRDGGAVRGDIPYGLNALQWRIGQLYFMPQLVAVEEQASSPSQNPSWLECRLNLSSTRTHVRCARHLPVTFSA